MNVLDKHRPMDAHFPVVAVAVFGETGSGKTSLIRSLCLELQDEFKLAVISTDLRKISKKGKFLDQKRVKVSYRNTRGNVKYSRKTAIRVLQMCSCPEGLDFVFIEASEKPFESYMHARLIDINIVVIPRKSDLLLQVEKWKKKVNGESLVFVVNEDLSERNGKHDAAFGLQRGLCEKVVVADLRRGVGMSEVATTVVEVGRQQLLSTHRRYAAKARELYPHRPTMVSVAQVAGEGQGSMSARCSNCRALLIEEDRVMARLAPLLHLLNNDVELDVILDVLNWRLPELQELHRLLKGVV